MIDGLRIDEWDAERKTLHLSGPIRLREQTVGLKMDYPPGIHALIAFRNLHRNTGVLDDPGQAVQE